MLDHPEGAELWFDPNRSRDAVAVCKTCPALRPCRDYADEVERNVPAKWWVGVWGGETVSDRRVRHRPRSKPQPDRPEAHAYPISPDAGG